MARKQIVHVAQDAIRRNAKNGTDDPAIIVNTKGKAQRFNEVEIRGTSGELVGVFKYQPHDPLSCGARVWLELEDGWYADGK